MSVLPLTRSRIPTPVLSTQLTGAFFSPLSPLMATMISMRSPEDSNQKRRKSTASGRLAAWRFLHSRAYYSCSNCFEAMSRSDESMVYRKQRHGDATGEAPSTVVLIAMRIFL